MILFVDIGNSQIKYVPYMGDFGDVTSVKYDKSSIKNTIAECMSTMSPPEKIIGINVAGESIKDQFISICQMHWAVVPEFIDVAKTLAGVTNGYKDINQLGIDRWMAVIAAWHRVKTNVMVIDIGSAMTIDLVNNEAEHLGGYLIPGDYLMTKSLFDNTDIDSVIGEENFELNPGRSTNQCIVNGTGRAIIGLITDVYQSINEDQPRYHCIITGGGAKKIIEYLTMPLDYQPLLVFKGMKIAAGIS